MLHVFLIVSIRNSISDEIPRKFPSQSSMPTPGPNQITRPPHRDVPDVRSLPSRGRIPPSLPPHRESQDRLSGRNTLWHKILLTEYEFRNYKLNAILIRYFE